MRLRDAVIIVLAIGLIGLGAISSLLSMRGNVSRAALYERVVSETGGVSDRLREMAAKRIQHNIPTERLGPAIPPPEGEETIDSKFWALLMTRPQEFNTFCTPEPRWTPEDRAWVEKMRALMDEIRPMLRAVPFPELSEDDFGSAGMLLQEHAVLALSTGAFDEARDDLSLMGALIPISAQQHPAAGYSRSLLPSAYLGTLRLLLFRQPPTGEALRASLAPLAGMNFLANYPDRFANKKIQAVMMFKDWEDTSYVASVESSGIYWGTRNWLWTNAAGPLYTRDVEAFMDYCDQLHAATAVPYPEGAPALARLRKELGDLGATYNDTRNLGYEIRSYETSVTRQQDAHHYALAGQILLAREAAGSWPNDLDALGPDAAPYRLDLFTGKPLRYEILPDNTGFKLTSAGPDGQVPSNDDVVLPWPLPDPCAPQLATRVGS